MTLDSIQKQFAAVYSNDMDWSGFSERLRLRSSS